MDMEDYYQEQYDSCLDAYNKVTEVKNIIGEMHQKASEVGDSQIEERIVLANILRSLGALSEMLDEYEELVVED